MLNTLDFDIMKQNLNEVMYSYKNGNSAQELIELGFKYYFLIKTLVDYEKGNVCTMWWREYSALCGVLCASKAFQGTGRWPYMAVGISYSALTHLHDGLENVRGDRRHGMCSASYLCASSQI